MSAKTLKVGWMFPDTLYLHGDRGNVLALKHMGEAVGYTVEIEKIDFDTEDFTPMEYDFLFCSPGEIASFSSIIDFLEPYELSLRGFIQAGRPLLVTGTSMALWGNEITREDSSILKGLGIIDLDTKENKAVYGDDIYFSCALNGTDMEIIGNQIQMADFILIGDDAPLGKVIYGYGNNGSDLNEGLQIKNAVFTNTLGPILVCNPWMTEAFIRIIAENQDEALGDFSINMDLERQSFTSKKEFILSKTTQLTNCRR